MSNVNTHAAPAPAVVGRSRSTSLVAWLAAGLAAVLVVAALAVAVWPESEADKARADGEQLGQAVAQLYDAQSSADVEAALGEVHAAVVDTRDHAGEAVAAQAADQEDALARAVDGFVGAGTSTDDFEAELYQAELDVALDDLSRQATDFRDQGPEVRQAFWEGYEDGLAVD